MITNNFSHFEGPFDRKRREKEKEGTSYIGPMKVAPQVV